MGHQGQPAAHNRIARDIDFPDPLDSSDEAEVGDGEDLLSQLAGDEVDRMMSSDSLEPISSDEAAGRAARLNPVQELTSQLDTFFEELRHRQEEAAAVVDQIPEANPIEINEQERAALDAGGDEELAGDIAAPEQPETPKDLIAHYESKKSTPLLLRPFDRGGAWIEGLSPLIRATVNLLVVVTFLAACAALAYVLMLRAA
jgi:hypothetical protein